MNHPTLDPIQAETLASIREVGADARRKGIGRGGVPYAHPDMRAAWLAGWDGEPEPLLKRFEGGGALVGG